MMGEIHLISTDEGEPENDADGFSMTRVMSAVLTVCG